MEELQNFLLSFLIVSITGIICVISTYFTLYMKKITDKVSNEIKKEISEEQMKLVNKSIERVNVLVYNSVFSAQNTIIQAIKKTSEDGKITLEDGKKIKNIVKNDILKQISVELNEIVKSEIGDIEAYVENQIEIQLEKIKTEIIK